MAGRGLWRGLGLASPARRSKAIRPARSFVTTQRPATTTASTTTVTTTMDSATTAMDSATTADGCHSRGSRPPLDAFQLTESCLQSMMGDIHLELEEGLPQGLELGEVSRYYFSGAGKAVRPVIALCVGRAASRSQGGRGGAEVERRQRWVALVAEMIHTASLLHDDVLDHSTTRRGRPSANAAWDQRRATLAGDHVLAVGARLMAGIGSVEVTVVLSQVLSDLVQGELQQLDTRPDEGQERFEHYLTKSFNKTASLMAHSCQATALLAGVGPGLVQDSFLYGRNIGVAFQLVDDLLDFTASADQLGKPAATDLSLGLATAPVLFAAERFPRLNTLIARRFDHPGDVEEAFRLVGESGGLEETQLLARKHCGLAVEALSRFDDGEYKSALVGLCDTVLTRLK